MGERKAPGQASRNRPQNTAPIVQHNSLGQQPGIFIQQEIVQLKRLTTLLIGGQQRVHDSASSVVYEYKSETVLSEQSSLCIQKRKVVTRRLLGDECAMHLKGIANKNKDMNLVHYIGKEPKKKESLPHTIMDIVKQSISAQRTFRIIAALAIVCFGLYQYLVKENKEK
ncbi:hypothetical protein D918_04260 [Trichuris suis]|nr:hypothetical protein D918_04260 [Trichuris suis]